MYVFTMFISYTLRRRNITTLVLTASSFILTIFKLAAQPGPVSAAVFYCSEKFVCICGGRFSQPDFVVIDLHLGTHEEHLWNHSNM